MADGEWSVAEAKAKFSEVIDRARTEGPQRVTRNGKDAVVVVSAMEWERRVPTRTMYDFLERSPLKGARLDLERNPDQGPGMPPGVEAGMPRPWTFMSRRHMLKPMPQSDPAMAERRVKLFRNGRNQAVRIPREFELAGTEAVMRKEGHRLIIEAAAPESLLALLATLDPLEDDFPPIADPAPESIDL